MEEHKPNPQKQWSSRKGAAALLMLGSSLLLKTSQPPAAPILSATEKLQCQLEENPQSLNISAISIERMPVEARFVPKDTNDIEIDPIIIKNPSTMMFGTEIQKLLTQHPHTQRFIIRRFVNETEKEIYTLPRATLEHMRIAADLARKQNNITAPLKIYLSGSQHPNAHFVTSYFDGGKTSKHRLIINLGLFRIDHYTLRDLTFIIFHEIAGHGTERFEQTSLNDISFESRADSLGVLGTRDYAGAAKHFIINYHNWDSHPRPFFPKSDHPDNLSRIMMTVRMFAHDPSLTYTQRRNQYKELETLNCDLLQKDSSAPDLLDYYHAEFAKAHSAQNHQRRLESQKSSSQGRNY